MNLESDLYVLAKSLAKAEDCTISAAVNRLLRRSLPANTQGKRRSSVRPKKRNGLVISRGRVPVTSDIVKAAEAQDDDA